MGVQRMVPAGFLRVPCTVKGCKNSLFFPSLAFVSYLSFFCFLSQALLLTSTPTLLWFFDPLTYTFIFYPSPAFVFYFSCLAFYVWVVEWKLCILSNCEILLGFYKTNLWVCWPLGQYYMIKWPCLIKFNYWMYDVSCWVDFCGSWRASQSHCCD